VPFSYQSHLGNYLKLLNISWYVDYFFLNARTL
jgi:hypothetical protein